MQGFNDFKNFHHGTDKVNSFGIREGRPRCIEPSNGSVDQLQGNAQAASDKESFCLFQFSGVRDGVRETATIRSQHICGT